MAKKWKETCDHCQQAKEDCHGYDGKILCPECATKLGYPLWQPKLKKGNENE